jgi:cell division septum initiation protein DivIVA
MSTSGLATSPVAPSHGTPEIVLQALAACDYEQQRLEQAIVEVQARIEAARSSRSSLPSLGRMLSEAHDEMETMERVYTDAAARVLRNADAEASSVVGSIADRR